MGKRGMQAFYGRQYGEKALGVVHDSTIVRKQRSQDAPAAPLLLRKAAVEAAVSQEVFSRMNHSC